MGKQEHCVKHGVISAFKPHRHGLATLFGSLQADMLELIWEFQLWKAPRPACVGQQQVRSRFVTPAALLLRFFLPSVQAFSV